MSKDHFSETYDWKLRNNSPIIQPAMGMSRRGNKHKTSLCPHHEEWNSREALPVPSICHFTPSYCNGLGRGHRQFKPFPPLLSFLPFGSRVGEGQESTTENRESNMLTTLCKHIGLTTRPFS